MFTSRYLRLNKSICRPSCLPCPLLLPVLHVPQMSVLKTTRNRTKRQCATKVLNNTWQAYSVHQILLFNANNKNLLLFYHAIQNILYNIQIFKMAAIATTVRSTTKEIYIYFVVVQETKPGDWATVDFLTFLLQYKSV